MYDVQLTAAAVRSLERLPVEVQRRVLDALDLPGPDPRPAGAVKLSGRDEWRIRVGDHRVIYDIRDRELLVLVIVIGHRREIYR